MSGERAQMAAAFAALALSIGQCACAHQKYSAPSPAAMIAAGTREAVAVTGAAEQAASAKQSVQQAQVDTGRAEGMNHSLGQKLSTLRAMAPVELQPQIDDIAADIAKETDIHTTLAIHLSKAEAAQSLLQTHLTEAQSAHAEGDKAKATYIAEAMKLADKATEESAARAAVEKKLSWYRWHWWGAWIALGTGVLACGLIAFLKFTGRLAIIGAGVASKF